jgi:hypothetical protein
VPRQFGRRDESVKWSCDKCRQRHKPGAPCPPTGVWAGRGTPSTQPGVVWLVRPMPDGQWPVDQRLPRDDSFSWWVRSHCGHEGGAKQWAFYSKHYADQYEWVFRDDPCRYTRCPTRAMIENDGRSRG